MDDDDDQNSQDNKLLAQIKNKFYEQSILVNQLFNFVGMLSKKENLADKIIVEYPDMGAMLARGMLFT